MVLTTRSMLAVNARRPFLLSARAAQHVPQLRYRYTHFGPASSPNLKIKSRTPEEGHALLAAQRLRRPVAPHLSIYKFQVHSVSSAMERNTGILLSASLYLFGTGYLVAPSVLGVDVSSASLVAAFAGLPLAAKVAIKFLYAWPFTFHVVNGVRYVVTAVGTQTLSSREQVVRIAWGVVGVSFVSALGLIAYF
ncbi:fumarate reductase respiratory complex transmembrane subunit [Aspergillus pseudoustus]|uniref:Fumarate reductase respiratory complex transmembrane subunit n=1 Tax=Aspergillus pseudoustus TaxID=1810923 RepID=A0ABR4K672_9EURO